MISSRWFLLCGIAACVLASLPALPRGQAPVKTINFVAESNGAPTASPLLLPLALEKLGNISLSGTGADLGDGLALVEGSIPVGKVLVGAVPFQFSPKALDVSTSMSGIREAIRAKYSYLHENSTGSLGRLVATVPADQYAAVHVVAFSRTYKDAVPRMTVRYGMFGNYAGILVNARVEVPDIRNQGKVSSVVARIPVKLTDGKTGYLYHLRIPLANSGNLWELKGKASLEFTRDINAHVNLPDPNEFADMPLGFPSGVVVLGATLEKSPVTVSYTTTEAGNVFYDTQQPVFNVKITNRSEKVARGRVLASCAGPGTADEYGLGRKAWTATTPFSVKPGETAEVPLDVTPRSKKRGWYSCTVAVEVNGHPVQARETTFALLAPDTRKAFDESPFGTWEFWMPHNTFFAKDQYEKKCDLIKKGGWRWTYGGAPSKIGSRYGEEMTAADYREIREKYGFRMTLTSPPEAYQRGTGWYNETEFQAKVVPALKAARERGYDNAFKVLHESRSSDTLLRRVNDFLGGAPYDMPAEEKAQIDQQFENVKQYCAAIKKADPTARIVLINDYPGVAIEYMKRGFPKELFEIFGLEGAMFMREPERQPDWLCLLGQAETMRRAMKHYGYDDKQLWTTEALYHATNPGNLTLHRQGVSGVREMMLALGSGFSKLSAAGLLKDSSDDYAWSNWGSGGYCFREPELNPKPSYTMVAWLTQILDEAKFAGYVKSNSTSLHVLDFKKKDGSHVYPVWVVRGMQQVMLKVEGNQPVLFDVYGNPLPAPIKNGAINVLATETPVYLTGVTVTGVAARVPVEMKDTAGASLLEFDDPTALVPVTAPSKTLESSWDYPRLQGKFTTEYVKEDGATALKVTLQPDDDRRTLFQRYVELALAKPITLTGRPFAFTARVKGNGGWGRLMFEMVDAKGRIWTSCGNQYAGSCNSSDNKGDSYISFDGWQTMRIQIAGQYGGADQVAAWPGSYNWWPENTPEFIELQKQYADALTKYEASLSDYQTKLPAYNTALAEYEAKKKAGDNKVRPPAKLNEPQKPGFRNYGIARVDYPVKLTKVIIAMPRNMLYVNGEIPVANPTIWIDRLGVEQPPAGM